MVARCRSPRAPRSCRPPSRPASRFPTTATTPVSASTRRAASAWSRSRRCRKLQTSCSTPVAEGMVVHTHDPEAVEGRAGVFEFLLINHPLDCPVCDKGGECPLQDFSYTFGNDAEPHGLPAAHVRRRGREGRRRLRPDADAEPQPLHPVHALRALHARSGRRRADRHHQPRQRQRDRDLQRAGRPLAALGQPDGRVPGRRHHHQAVPLPLAAVGQPARRRHHLHAVLEGLQHHGVAQGQAGMGQGRAPRARHAALQRRGQRLLDVRHRPLPVPLGRRRPAPAQADDR